MLLVIVKYPNTDEYGKVRVYVLVVLFMYILDVSWATWYMR